MKKRIVKKLIRKAVKKIPCGPAGPTGMQGPQGLTGAPGPAGMINLEPVTNAISALETIQYIAHNMGLKNDGMKSIYEFADYAISRLSEVGSR